MNRTSTTYQRVIESALFAYASHRLILDETSKVIDFEFIDVNKSYSELVGRPVESIVGFKLSDVFPELINGNADFLIRFAEVGLQNKNLEFEEKSSILDRWFKVHAFSPEHGTVVTMSFDITDQKRDQEVFSSRMSQQLQAADDPIPENIE